MQKGLFITFEGPEGSGKSTHMGRLAERLEGMGVTVRRTREPGGTPTGEAIRDILQHDAAGEDLTAAAEVLLFEASRAQLVQTLIKPALARGECVLCDRFADSTTAYQGYARGLGVEAMLGLNAFAVQGLEPDVTVLLDIDVARGFERLGERNRATNAKRDRIEREAVEFHEQVRAGYLDLARRWPDRFRVVNADRDTDVVAADVWAAVRAVVEPAG